MHKNNKDKKRNEQKKKSDVLTARTDDNKTQREGLEGWRALEVAAAAAAAAAAVGRFNTAIAPHRRQEGPWAAVLLSLALR